MRVLSLFDGMRCGRIALDRANIKVDKYFSSEVDPHPIKIADKNYPQDAKNKLGDVTKINFEELGEIDLLIGGSPCQGFSVAGKKKGMVTKENIEITSLEQYLKLKSEGFEFEGQSYLFFEFVNALKILKPKYWLLENVRVNKNWLPVMNEVLGCEPIFINSQLVSAQSRPRYYWTNIQNISQPLDKKIYLKDIIEFGFYDGSECVDGLEMIRVEEIVRVRKYPVDVEKLKLLLKDHKKKSAMSINLISSQLNQPKTLVEHWFRSDNSFSIPSEDIWFSLKKLLNIETNDFDKSIMSFEIREGKFDMSKRVYKINGKAPTLTTITGGKQRKIIDDNYQIRELTPLECERLQTLPDNYTQGASQSQRFKMIGNGWTVDVIAHILSNLPFQYKLSGETGK